MSIASYEGGGRNGHLGKNMNNEKYFAIAGDVFPVLANHGPSDVVMAGMKVAVIAETTILHREATQVYRTHHNVDQAIKKLLIVAFDDGYLNALSDDIVGYTNCTSLQILTHLLTYYAMIAPTELTQNYERLNMPYDPNQPIETLFQQIQDAWAFTVAGGQPYGAAMIVNVAYTLMFNTGLHPDACHAWQSRVITAQTWAQFKIVFSTAHREFHLTNQTAQQSGFHSANVMIEQGWDESMQETAEAIAQLATATASDQGTVATLTTTNVKLANQLEAAHALIAQLKSKVATLNIKIKPVCQGQRPTRNTSNESYCWSHGYQVANSHTSATCNVRKTWQEETATKVDTMGGVQWGKEWCGGAAKDIDDKINHFALSLDCTLTTTNAPADDTAIIDSGCTSNLLSAAAPCSDKQAAHVPLNVNMHNGMTIQLSHTCNLLLTDLPHQARQAYILPGLVHNSLISVDKLCDKESSVTFPQDQVTVSRNGKDVMYVSQDPKSRLWRVNLKQQMNNKITQCNHAHDNNNQKYLIYYLHASCFSPVKSTWIKAIKNGIFSSWPGLNRHSVEKYLSKSNSTVKGHLNQQRQNSRTTKIKDAPLLDSDADLDHGIKTQYVYAAAIDAGQIYTDQTGRFTVVSSKGNKYIMVLYDNDSNSILAKPIKDRTAPELLKTFQLMEQELVARCLKPKLMKLDNDASKLLKDYLYQQDIIFQLVPSYSHRRNSAEQAIRSFKDHLIAALC
jgi:hypothetical protein